MDGEGKFNAGTTERINPSSCLSFFYPPSVVVLRSSLVPFGWRVSPTVVSPSSPLSFRVSLVRLQSSRIEDLFWRVSNPQHPEYGNYLSVAGIRQLVAPSPQQVHVVTRWLETQGIGFNNTSKYEARWSELGDEVTATLPVAVAEQLLHAKYEWYEHAGAGTTVLACRSYILPEEVAQAVAHIGPTLHMHAHLRWKTKLTKQTLRKQQQQWDASERLQEQVQHATQQQQQQSRQHSVSSVLPTASIPFGASPSPSCTPFVDLECLRSLYRLGFAYGRSSVNSIAATGYHSEFIASSDIDLFQRWFDPLWLQCDVTVIGPNDESQPGGEATMDVQLMMGIAANVPAIFWSTGGAEPHGPAADEPFLAFMSALLADESPPLVVSTSYGDDELDLDIGYINHANSQFQLAGLRGISLLFASGDGGVAGGYGTANCSSGFVAVFPSASPFVTAVGGTQLLSAAAGGEVGVDFSSGGFSNYWKQPTYQADAVRYYLEKSGAKLPEKQLFNAAGRAFPDVSAMSSNLPTVLRGAAWPAGGTSCASPIFAGVVALLNDARLMDGQSPLGFLNPWLYAHWSPQSPSGALNDIVQGNNPGCGTDGFYAAVGWDPVTGLGTPNWQNMTRALQQQRQKKELSLRRDAETLAEQ